MSANVETMFYVREVPWHGLGTRVEEAPNSADAIRLAELDWRVESNPIYDMYGKEIPGFVANTRSSDNSVLGIVSPQYKIVQNSKAFEFTDSLLDEGVVYETAGSLKDGKMIWLLAKMPQQKILDDAFDPYICFTNSHDGTGAVKVCMTPVRVVCNNTLNLALSTAKRSWSARHMGNIDSKLEEARHTLGLANDYMKSLEEEADRLANIQVNDSQILKMFDELYPVTAETTARKIENINTIKDNFFRCYEMPDISQFKNTAWGVINAISDQATHSNPGRMTQKYNENNWGRVISGHPLIDNIYKKIAA